MLLQWPFSRQDGGVGMTSYVGDGRESKNAARGDLGLPITVRWAGCKGRCLTSEHIAAGPLAFDAYAVLKPVFAAVSIRDRRPIGAM